MVGGSLTFGKLALLLRANLDWQPMTVRLKKKNSQILPRVYLLKMYLIDTFSGHLPGFVFISSHFPEQQRW
jgi:hypothetical protein